MSALRRFANRFDEILDALRMHWRRLRGHKGAVRVHAHRGFASATRVYLTGHVVDGSADDPEPEPGVGLWADVRATVRRYMDSQILGARLTIRAGDASVGAVSDGDGYFAVELHMSAADGEGDGADDRVRWRKVSITLDKVPGSSQPAQDFATEVMIVPARARFGVISDIDDTVMATGIHDFRRNWRQVIRSDPRLRQTFPGLPELYRALAYDRQGVQRQPIFYVSSASWGFYRLFARFLDLQEIPQGPLLLKNYGLDREQWFSGDHALHKKRAIERLLATYPELPFILVGDSGQHDAKIYRDLVERHPQRVLAVWIRDVSAKPERRAEVSALIDGLRDAGVPVAFGPHLLAAARDAAQRGWIDASAVADVQAAVQPGGEPAA